MKVLASYPDGRATVAAMKADLALLAGAGPAWGERLRRLAARSPGLDIFSQGLVTCDATGWQLTSAGQDRLREMEAPTQTEPPRAVAPVLDIVPAVAKRLPAAISIAATTRRPRRRSVGTGRSA